MHTYSTPNHQDRIRLHQIKSVLDSRAPNDPAFRSTPKYCPHIFLRQQSRQHKILGSIVENMPGAEYDNDAEFLFHQRLALAILSLSPLIFAGLLGFRLGTYGKHLFPENRSASSGDPRKREAGPLGSSLRRRHKSNSSDNDTINRDRETEKLKNADMQEHQSKHWLGPLLPTQWSWVFFESPCCIWVILCLYDLCHDGRTLGATTASSIPEPLPFANKILLSWFFFHYFYRSVWYPLVLMNTRNDRGMPLGITFTAWCICNANGYLQARDLTKFHKIHTGPSTSFSFWLGICLILIGFYVVVTSDLILVKLKQTNQRAMTSSKGGRQHKSYYGVPFGGLFRYVSSPHYLGELVEWTGFYLATGCSLASLSFVISTASNLVPRAIQTHNWYLDTFVGTSGQSENGNRARKHVNGDVDETNRDYSQLDRKAIIPFIL